MLYSMDYSDRIEELRAKMGSRLIIMAHHYQSDEIIRHADLTGDSLELARKIPSNPEYIVFCGVHFMAESAAILAAEKQKTFIPVVNKCVMAETAPSDLIESVYAKITATGRKVIPLAYVNSSAAVKAFCGRNGGSVCTSANASTMMQWAMDQGDAVLFLPDKNLAVNTASNLSIPIEEQRILRVRGNGACIDADASNASRLLIWPGCCPVHHIIKTSDIDRVRKETPEALVAVHPECRPDVVQAADADGSTSFLIKYVETAPHGARIAVGTEINLVERLAQRCKNNKHIFPLARVACSNMGLVDQEKLFALLQDLAGPRNTPSVTVDAATAEPARIALERMLAVCA